MLPWVQWKQPQAEEVWRALRYDRPLPGHEKQKSGTGTSHVSDLKTPPENIHVQVLNGSGIPGAAAQVASELENEGFVVTSVGDASRNDYQTTQVRHDPAYNESARTLSAALPGSVDKDDVSLSSTLVVIVGADQPHVVKVHVPGSTASPNPEETIKTHTANQNICH